MTVDMLAATFFWPEGALLGSRQPHPEEPASGAVPPGHGDADDAAPRAEGFWAAVVRHLWRPAETSAPL